MSAGTCCGNCAVRIREQISSNFAGLPCSDCEQHATCKQTYVILWQSQKAHAYRGNSDQRRPYEIYWERQVRAFFRLQLSLALRPDPWGQLFLCFLQH